MWLPDDGFIWTETCLSSFYNFNYFHNLRILKSVCISWNIKCLILLMHCANMTSMKFCNTRMVSNDGSDEQKYVPHCCVVLKCCAWLYPLFSFLKYILILSVMLTCLVYTKINLDIKLYIWTVKLRSYRSVSISHCWQALTRSFLLTYVLNSL